MHALFAVLGLSFQVSSASPAEQTAQSATPVCDQSEDEGPARHGFRGRNGSPKKEPGPKNTTGVHDTAKKQPKEVGGTSSISGAGNG